MKLVSSFVAFYIPLEMPLSVPDGGCLSLNHRFRLEVVLAGLPFVNVLSKVSLETFVFDNLIERHPTSIFGHLARSSSSHTGSFHHKGNS